MLIDINNLKTSVEQLTGNFQFQLDLLGYPSKQESQLVLPAHYSSNSLIYSTNWNQSAPTSVMGLGWTLGGDYIVVDLNNSGSESSNQYYLSIGGTLNPLVMVSEAGEITEYKTLAYQFWKITYNSTEQAWYVIKENGSVDVFGGEGLSGNAVQNVLVWGNWVGASINGKRQRLIPIMWNINRRIDRFGNKTTFEYEQVLMSVSDQPPEPDPRGEGLTTPYQYAQASYLIAMVGPLQDRIELNYEDKVKDEYQDPHANPVPPNGFQDRFETKYLSSIDYYARGEGQATFTTRFIYSIANGSTAFVGEGQLSKRLLMGISVETENQPVSPPLEFSYYGQLQADGVNSSHVYDESTQALYGGMKRIIAPEGGELEINYAQIEPILSEVDVSVAAPQKEGYQFSQPKIDMQDEFTVVSWYGEQEGTANPIVWVDVFSWAGRWLKVKVLELPITSTENYAAGGTLTSQDFFVVSYAGQVNLFHKNANLPNAWVSSIQPYNSSSNVEARFLNFTGTPQIETCDRFVAIYDETSHVLTQYTFNGVQWLQSASTTPTAGTFTKITAQSNTVMVVSQSDQITHIQVQYLTPNLGWRSIQGTVETNLVSVDQLELFAGVNYFVLLQAAHTGAGKNVDYVVITFDSAMSSMESVVVLQDFVAASASPTIPVIFDSVFQVGNNVLRFDGDQWHRVNLAEFNLPEGAVVNSLSLGAMHVVRVLKLSNGTDYQFDFFEYSPTQNTWGTIGESYIGTDAAAVSHTAAAGAFGSNYVLVANALRNVSPGGSATTSFTLPADLSLEDKATATISHSRFLVYQNGNNLNAVSLRNGGVVSETPMQLVGESAFIPDYDSDHLLSRNSILSYTGAWGDAASIMRLRRVSENRLGGQNVQYVVDTTTLNTGYQLLVNAYEFDATTAVMAPNSESILANKVTHIDRGSNEQGSPYGSTQTYMYNGLSAAEPLRWPIHRRLQLTM